MVAGVQGLRKLGASDVIGMLSSDSKALDEERWGGAIDVVGGGAAGGVGPHVSGGAGVGQVGARKGWKKWRLVIGNPSQLVSHQLCGG